MTFKHCRCVSNSSGLSSKEFFPAPKWSKSLWCAALKHHILIFLCLCFCDKHLTLFIQSQSRQYWANPMRPSVLEIFRSTHKVIAVVLGQNTSTLKVGIKQHRHILLHCMLLTYALSIAWLPLVMSAVDNKNQRVNSPPNKCRMTFAQNN